MTLNSVSEDSQYFTVDQITPLSHIPAGSQVHVIGVCGVAMAPLAVALRCSGYRVSGSDREYYDPMAGVLLAGGIDGATGYSSENIPDECALVIVGNSVRRDNPEVLEVAKRAIPYSIFPAIVRDFLLADRHGIVVAGTHGKSTTTTMLASTLAKLEADPSFFMGALPVDLPHIFHRGHGKFCVVEGDEYDSSFFAKVPKFQFYPAGTLVVTSLEYDHADIYESVTDIEELFTAKIISMPAGSHVFVFADTPRLESLVEEWRKKSPAEIVTFGFSGTANVRIVSREELGLEGRQEVRLAGRISGKSIDDIVLSVPLSGEHNALNATAAFSVLQLHGFPPGLTVDALSRFGGLRRRQELLVNTDKVVLIEDFAHHPTAVRVTLQGLRQRYPDKRLVAVFEPRSNTSRRKIFEDDYLNSLALAHEVILSEVTPRRGDEGLELLSSHKIVAGLLEQGVKANCCESYDDIYSIFAEREFGGEVVVVMSNGGFGGLPGRLKRLLG